MGSERLTFPGSLGADLTARLDRPTAEPRAYAVLAHCFTCSKDVLAASRISKALASFGIAVLRFDFTGLGGSGGDFSHTDFSSNVADLVAAADHLRSRFDAPRLLVGHSLGGAAVLAAANRIPEVRAVATIAAPDDTAHVMDLLTGSLGDLEEHGEAEVVLAGRPFRIRRQFVEDVTGQPQAERIRNLHAALLVLHSPDDDTVSIDNARRIFDTARHPKSFVSLDGADHLLTDRRDADFAAAVIAAWADRYLPGQPASAPPNEGGQDVVVSEDGATRYSQRVTVGRHELTADEPEPVGADTGPSPYDLVLAGLGACTSMTLRMYADRKGWPLEGVTVTLRHSRIHADDCASCETQTGRLDHIERVVEMSGDLEEEQRRQLLVIADKCPVHRTLHSEIVVTTSGG